MHKANPCKASNHEDGFDLITRLAIHGHARIWNSVTGLDCLHLLPRASWLEAKNRPCDLRGGVEAIDRWMNHRVVPNGAFGR